METLAVVHIDKLFDVVLQEQNPYIGRWRSVMYHVPCDFFWSAEYFMKFGFWNGRSGAFNSYCPSCGKALDYYQNIKFCHSTLSGEAPIACQLKLIKCKNWLDLEFKFTTVLVSLSDYRIQKLSARAKEVIRFDFKQRKVFFIKGRDFFEVTLRDLTGSRLFNYFFSFLHSESCISEYQYDLTLFFSRLQDEFVKMLSDVVGYKVKHVRMGLSFRTGGTMFKHLLRNLVWKMDFADAPRLTKDMFNFFKIYDNMNMGEVKKFSLQGNAFYKSVLLAEGLRPYPSYLKFMKDNPLSIFMFRDAASFTANPNLVIRLLNVLISDAGSSFIYRHIDTSNEKIDAIKGLIEIYGEVAIIRYIENLKGDLSYFNDSVDMFKKLCPEYKARIWRAKPALKKLHEELVYYTNLQKKENVILPQREDLNDSVQGFKFYNPYDVKQLMSLGKQMHNCVATYKEKILGGDANIVGVKAGKAYMACFEIKNGAVVQAKLKHNVRLYNNLAVRDAVVQWCKDHNLKIGFTADFYESEARA